MIKNKRKYRSRNRMRSYTNKKSYIFLICIIVAIIISIVFLKLGLDYKEDVVSIYSYKANKNANYEVLLKPNNFYDSKTLLANRYYASKSIDSYMIDFVYNFGASKDANIDYSYNITADIIGTVSSNGEQKKEIWNKTFYLLDETHANTDKNEFSINEHVDINYDYYNNLARLYEETYLVTIEAVLKVRLNVSYSIDLSYVNRENKKIDDYIELEISLTDTISNAKENYQKDLSDNITENVNKITINQIIYFVCSFIFLIIAVVLIIIKIRQNSKTPEEKYKRNIKRIIKYYRDLIVTVKNEPNIKDLKIMQIQSLEDLIDVAEQNKSNIIHYEEIENVKSNLYVIVNGYVYIYVVT